MPDYRRTWLPGGTYFFTLVTNQRRPIFYEAQAREALRGAFQWGMEKAGPFQLDALCLLPDHLHCIWTLPENDGDFSTRWKVIKAGFSRHYLRLAGNPELVSRSKFQKGEQGVWQRRFWEHLIRNREDFSNHLDYLHYNPVKHGLLHAVKDWPWSTFHRYVQEGYYNLEWGDELPEFDSTPMGE